MSAQNFKYFNNWKNEVPEPVFDNKPEMVEFYWKAWELAYDHIKERSGMPQTPYMDEGFSETDIWIWDTCFMSLFCKYSPEVFPGIETLNNFYAPIHDNVQVPLRVHILDNPPLFAWVESEYYQMTNDKEHLTELMNKTKYLQKHFQWFNNPPNFVMSKDSDPNTVCLKKADGGFHWEGARSGMDNTPRGRVGERAVVERPNNPKMLWVDAISQQGLSALCISRLAAQVGNKEEAELYQNKYEEIKKQVNELYWNEDDGIYYDVDVETKEHMKVKTVASFWPMLAEMCSSEQAAKMVKLIENPDLFGGIVPFPSLARNDVDFAEDGCYWRGGIWLPTAYMGIKGLEKYGYYELASDSAEKIVEYMIETYNTYSPSTIWECYNPNKPLPSRYFNLVRTQSIVRPDFCGWSALGPISLFIENILGFHSVDAANKRVEWRKSQTGTHGIRNLKFGNIKTDIIGSGDTIEVLSNEPYTLVVNGKEFAVKSGAQTLSL